MARRTARAPEDSVRFDRAWRATRAFNRMLPNLNGYVRALTRNPKVSVRATAAESRTDGQTIWIRPPARLGDDLQHRKVDCNTRDQITMRQLCPACDVNELVMAALYHEMAHIIFGTMIPPNQAGIDAFTDLVVEWHPLNVCTHADEIANKWRQMKIEEKNYLGLMSLLSEQLSFLLNSMEDARVNASQFDARPGTRAMMTVHLREVFESGVEHPDSEEIMRWQDQPLPAQVLIGAFLRASECYEELEMLSDEAQTIIGNDDVDVLLGQVSRADDVHEVTRLAIKLYRLLHVLGCFNEKKCEVKQDTDEESNPDENGQDGPADQPGQEGSEDSAESSISMAGIPSGSGGTESNATSDSGSSFGGIVDSPSEADDSDPNEQETPDRNSRDESGSGEESDRLGSSNELTEEESDDGRFDSGESTYHDTVDPVGNDGDRDDEESEGESIEELTPEEVTERMRQAMQRMTLHNFIKNHVPDQDRKDLACGHSYLAGNPASGEDVTEVMPGVAQGGWGDAGSDGEIEHLAIAISQAMFFEAPSRHVDGVCEIVFPDKPTGWRIDRRDPGASDPARYMPGENIIGNVVNTARITFEENRRSRHQVGLRSGRINSRVLGKRAPTGDDRLFRKKTIPGKRDYAVVLGFDMSGSTASAADDGGTGVYETINSRIKRAVFAQAETLSRLGIPFEVWGHSAGYDRQRDGDTSVWMFRVKTKDDPWNKDAKVRLAACDATDGNLDGHTLEFYRKRAEGLRATDRIICYYTDGAMPAMNAREERVILEREVAYCRKNGIPLLAVGIETDSPRQFGFDTVEVNNDMDLVKVVQQLKRSLTR